MLKDKDLWSEDKDMDLEVQGQGLVNWSSRILEDKDFHQILQHRVTVKNGLLTV